MKAPPKIKSFVAPEFFLLTRYEHMLIIGSGRTSEYPDAATALLP
jgi:hypothetical protein